jgi:hypothetical protein
MKLFVLLTLIALPISAQTMLDQQQRLIQIHSMLLDYPAVEAPGALKPGQLSVGVELITIPTIDGTTGSKKQITASDETPAFPRPRVAFGLPKFADGFVSFVGATYIPPIEIAKISTNDLSLEAGVAWSPSDLVIDLRAHFVYANSQSPVTDPNTRDTLKTTEYGIGVSAGYELRFGSFGITPYGGAGVMRLSGNFTVTSDGDVLTSDYTSLVLDAGARVLLWNHLEAVAELDWYPDRLLHPNFRVAYLFNF